MGSSRSLSRKLRTWWRASKSLQPYRVR
jgi:hypothetical protein